MTKLEEAQSEREQAAFEAMSQEKQWALMQHWRATEPDFASLWERGEGRVKAMSTEELLACVAQRQR